MVPESEDLEVYGIGEGWVVGIHPVLESQSNIKSGTAYFVYNELLVFSNTVLANSGLEILWSKVRNMKLLARFSYWILSARM